MPKMLTKELSRKSLIKRFHDAYTKVESGCWEWCKTLAFGYGKISYRDNRKSREIRAHRLSYEIFKNEIPKDMLVLHKCDNKKCVNPDHLFIGTQIDNIIDMNIKKRNVNLKGEETGYNKLKENDVIQIKKELKNGARICRLAEKYNVSSSCIYLINKNVNWKHINI